MERSSTPYTQWRTRLPQVTPKGDLGNISGDLIVGGTGWLLEATSVFSFSRRAQLMKIDHRKPINIIDKYDRLLSIGSIRSILIMRVLLILSIFIGLPNVF